MLIGNGMALILSRFHGIFHTLICVVLGIANAAYFIQYQAPADCVKLSDGADTSFYFNSVQLKCMECEQPSSAQTVSPDGAFGFGFLYAVELPLVTWHCLCQDLRHIRVNVRVSDYVCVLYPYLTFLYEFAQIIPVTGYTIIAV